MCGFWDCFSFYPDWFIAINMSWKSTSVKSLKPVCNKLWQTSISDLSPNQFPRGYVKTICVHFQESDSFYDFVVVCNSFIKVFIY